MANVYAGYRGLAVIGTVGQVRFADASITARQTVTAPDLVNGDWDKDAYYYGSIEVGGSISGPVTETFIAGSAGGGLWDWGVKRTGDCGLLASDTVTLYYYCGGSEMNTRTFGGMFVNTLGFSCAAGDVAQFTMDVLGSSAGAWSNAIPPHFPTAEKLITWDKVSLAITPSAGNPGGASFTPNPVTIAYSNFDFSIANNLTTVYSLGQPTLFPYEIVPGLRNITGSISVYNTPQANGYDSWDDYIAAGVSTIAFNIGTLAIDMKVRFFRVEPASSATPIISTIGFQGVSHQTGAAWE